MQNHIPRRKQKTITSIQRNTAPSMCALCRGTKFLCGKSRCPVIVRYHAKTQIHPHINSLKLDGASPPSVFIGRIGYPKISIGPMIPPVMGDTMLIDTPEQWLGKSLDDIVGFRSQLVRGKYLVDVHDVDSSRRIIEYTRDLALAKNPVYTEAVFEKKPYGRIRFYDEVQPHGPSAPLKNLAITPTRYEHHIEKAHYDTDLKAKPAILSIYNDGVRVSQIQRAFSVGAFGIKKHRRFVPTRWSITAVDSTISNEMMKFTRTNPLINEYRIYVTCQFDNRWIVLMMPTEWQYELIEAWYPNTTWNPYDQHIQIFNSYEFYDGRTTYAEIGGCYYAARLAVNEELTKERRQAGVVILREAHPGYIMPIGVWNVRESVRAALAQGYEKYDTLNEACTRITHIMDIPLSRWIKNSAILKKRLFQRRLEDFVKPRERE